MVQDPYEFAVDQEPRCGRASIWWWWLARLPVAQSSDDARSVIVHPLAYLCYSLVPALI